MCSILHGQQAPVFQSHTRRANGLHQGINEMQQADDAA
jgi:hypothetical protein